MKYVVLSFDDGRQDTYSIAVPIMKNSGLVATINVTSDFILTPNNYESFASGANKAMSVEQVCNSQKDGFEIACHGHSHHNSVTDIRENIRVMSSWGVKTNPIGFASPNSVITEKNLSLISELVGDEIVYIRSGRQVRREGLLYSLVYFFQEITNSALLFYAVNRRSLIQKHVNQPFYYGISITRYTTVKQLKYLLEHMPDDSGVIFIFHSVLSSSNEGYGVDKWFWDKSRFSDLCNYLKDNKDIAVITNMELNERFYDV